MTAKPAMVPGWVWPHLEIWVPQWKNIVDVLERDQQRATRIMKGWEHLTQVEGELGLFSLKNRRLMGVNYWHKQILEERAHRAWAWPLSSHPQWLDQLWQAQHETVVPSEDQKTLFAPHGGPSCPGKLQFPPLEKFRNHLDTVLGDLGDWL